MDRVIDHEDVIDLGAVSTETRGTPGVPDDNQGGLIFLAGLSEE